MSTDDNLSSSKRPFGLSFPSKPKSKTTTTLTPINKSCLAAAAFSLDDDDNVEQTTSSAKTNKLPISSRLALNPKAQRDIEEALEQDPNIYAYDEVYEQVSSTVQQEQKREEKKRLERESNTLRQAKYVTGLLEKSKEREKEFERVLERRIQREREQEGDLYADKEVFVTSAYKAKLAERQADLEREKLEEKREALLNVYQQDNMDAFYRFQFKVRTGDITILEESEKIKNEPSESNQKDSSTNRQARQLRSRTTNDDDQMEINSINDIDNDNMYVRAREKHTRSIQREHQQDVNDEVIIDEVSKSTQLNTTIKVRRINDEKTQIFDDEQIEMGVGVSGKKKKIQKEKDKDQKLINTKENDVSINMPIAHEKKRQAEETRIERIRRLCEKRTIGDVLEIAQQAYYEREQKRNLFKDYIERTES
ncbi:unnamed protein product [Rotaria sp. Silwood1]|nr:unnamed protein product [Rotaria sp. Silwood1]CAF3759055.1 unnamed protein product [Rotaria sp. Silwood1]CAF4695680.1 unnamed protein product [Rotaria sp. Silwood1]CAF4759355.1 unnamed protein product [Rotaria sp. Silwood1]